MTDVAKEVTQATKSMDSFSDSIKKGLMAFGPYGAAAAAALSIVGAAVAAAWSSFKRFAQETKAIKDGARSAKITREEYAELSYVSMKTGVSLESMVSAIQKVTDTLEKAKKGNEDYLAFYDALGLSIADIERMKPAEMLGAIAQAVNRSGLDIRSIPRSKRYTWSRELRRHHTYGAIGHGRNHRAGKAAWSSHHA